MEPIKWVRQGELCRELGISRSTAMRYANAGIFVTKPRKTATGGCVTLYNLSQAKRVFTQPS